MGDDITLFRVGLGGDRDHKPSATARTVAGVIIEMKRTETARTMISAGIAEGLNVQSAVLTDEFLVLLFKKLCFHYGLFFVRQRESKLVESLLLCGCRRTGHRLRRILNLRESDNVTQAVRSAHNH